MLSSRNPSHVLTKVAVGLTKLNRDIQKQTYNRLFPIDKKEILKGKRGGEYYINHQGNRVYIKSKQRARSP